MTAPLMPKATAVWLVENTTLTFKQIADFCELHELEIQAIADGDVSFNIIGLSPLDNNQLTIEEIKRCEADSSAKLVANVLERNVKLKNIKAKKMLSPTQRSEKPSAILWIIKNCPEIIDAQICKLVGTTKPTIAAIRKGTHRDMANIRPKNPVTIGLCSEKDLDKAITLCRTRAENALKAQEKKVKKKKAKKKAAPKKTAKKVTAKKTTKKAPAKKAATKATAKKTAKKASTKKTATKATAKKTAKKASTKKAPAKKVAPKATAKKTATKAASKKAPAKKTAAKATAKKATAKKTVAKATAKKAMAKKAAAKVTAKKAPAKKTVVKKKAK